MWHRDVGVDCVLEDSPQNHMSFKAPSPQRQDTKKVLADEDSGLSVLKTTQKSGSSPQQIVSISGSQALRQEAQAQAQAAQSLADLKDTIKKFEGIDAKKTAANMVFADGNPNACVMIIGDAPDADEDRTGRSFAGPAGQLFEKALSFIGLGLKGQTDQESCYVTSILNWRPPGNRTPTQAEIDISTPFVRRHIALVQPRILLLTGAAVTKTLLATPDGIQKLRSRVHSYTCENSRDIPVLVTHAPSNLLRLPAKKAEAWADLLALKELLRSNLTS